jgi:hypothetical protein
MIQMTASGYLFSESPEQPLQLDIEKDVFSDYCDGIEKAVGCNPKDKLKELYCQLQLSTMFEGEDCLVIPREFPFQLLFGAFDPMAAMEEAKKDNESVVIRPNYEVCSSDDEEVSVASDHEDRKEVEESDGDESGEEEMEEEPPLDEEEKARLARLEAVWRIKHHPLKRYFVVVERKNPSTKEGRVLCGKLLFANEGKTNKYETMANAADLKVFDPELKKMMW